MPRLRPELHAFVSEYLYLPPGTVGSCTVNGEILNSAALSNRPAFRLPCRCQQFTRTMPRKRLNPLVEIVAEEKPGIHSLRVTLILAVKKAEYLMPLQPGRVFQLLTAAADERIYMVLAFPVAFPVNTDEVKLVIFSPSNVGRIASRTVHLPHVLSGERLTATLTGLNVRCRYALVTPGVVSHRTFALI